LSINYSLFGVAANTPVTSAGRFCGG